MFQKSLFCIFIFCLWVAQSFATPKFPFPQDQAYPHGIKPANADHNAVQDAYKIFLDNFYEESGSQARIKWDTPTQTVSEGIGYGMLIMVYMDNATNNTQGKFDKLWAYYKNNLDSYGLMNWKISGFSGVVGSNSATDGDLDVAFALALASYQWGGSYLADAQSLLTKIWGNDVQGSVLCGGDNYKNVYNPSYVITAAIDLISKKSIDSHGWAGIATGCYNLIKTAQNGSTGLVPDWVNSDGTPNGTGSDYLFDATRIPWRMATAYCWYGDGDAQTIAGKMNSWIKSSTGNDPTKIKSGYQPNGQVFQSDTFNIPAFIGPFACAAMTDANSQAWLDACYDRLATFIYNDNYYNQCLKVMTLLLLTGNMPDLSTATPKTAFTVKTSSSPSTSGSVTVNPVKSTYAAGDQVTFTATPTGTNNFISWGGDLSGSTSPMTITLAHDMHVTAYFNAGSGDLIDDFEDGDSLNRMSGAWFTYNDVTSGGTSVITPLTSPTKPFVPSAGGAAGSTKCGTVTYTLHQGSIPSTSNPYVGFGCWIKKYAPPDTFVNISASTGLTFWFKGDTCNVKVETANIKDFGFFFKQIPKATDWTLVSLAWNQLAQPTWASKSTLDLTKATKIGWQTSDKGKDGNSGTISVDEIHLPGFVVPTRAEHRLFAPQRNKGISIVCDNTKSMTLRYSLPAPGAIEIGLFDLSGKMINRLFAGNRQSGYNIQDIRLPETRNQGTYVVQLKSNTGVYSDKITLVK